MSKGGGIQNRCRALGHHVARENERLRSSKSNMFQGAEVSFQLQGHCKGSGYKWMQSGNLQIGTPGLEARILPWTLAGSAQEAE